MKRFAIALIIAAFAGLRAHAEDATPAQTDAVSRTAIQMTGPGFRLLRDCAPFTVKGVHGSERLDELRDAGGNCVLAKDPSAAKAVLEKAAQAGLVTAVAIPFRQEGPMTYADSASVATAIRDIRSQVGDLKNHTALLLWIIQSDIADKHHTNTVAYHAVNVLAKVLHEEDPEHPIAVDIGTLDANSPKPGLLARYCPEVDVLGWTADLDYTNAVTHLRSSGWYKPYIIMRLGMRYPEMGESTPWLSPVEPFGAAKATWMLEIYSNLVASSQGLCLGSFAFSWDPCTFVTPTWFSLNYEIGARAEIVDSLAFAWTGSYPANRAPEIHTVTSAVNRRLTSAGLVHDAAVTASDPDSDPLSYEWVLVRESSLGNVTRGIPAQYEKIDGAIEQAATSRIRFTIPSEAGPYRLIVYVRDDKGHAASANIPFLVEATREPAAPVATQPAAEKDATAAPAEPGTNGPGSRVEIRHSLDGGWKLYVNDELFFVKGAGGQKHLDELKAAGGNAIRTWSTDFAGKVLDDAHERGLKVCLGLWMGQERHRFDYTDRKAVERQLNKLRAAVNQFKNHPALLMWCCGIEVEWGPATNPPVYQAINEVARMVHEEDPHHPTTTAFADIGSNSVKAAMAAQYCPDLDILGINSYGGLPSMADRLRDVGWVRPYMIMEFGPKGQWEVEQTSWGAEIEQMPLEKASFYLTSYLKSVSSSENWCLGSFVFSWDAKFECTPTWYSMHLLDGSKVNTVDTMWSAWSKIAPPNRCPQITAIESPLKHVKVHPSKHLDLKVTAIDPDGDSIRVEWVLMSEQKSKGSDGVVSTSLKPIEGRIKDPKAAKTQIQTPRGKGAYRVFCYVYDDRGGASTANMPFFVDAP